MEYEREDTGERRMNGREVDIPPIPSLPLLAADRFDAYREGKTLRQPLPLEAPFKWRVVRDGMEYIGEVLLGHIPSPYPDRPCERCEKTPSTVVRLLVVKTIHAAGDPTEVVTPATDAKLYESLEERLQGILCHEKNFCCEPSCLRFPRMTLVS